ncbi:LysR family transcriptional regulator [Aestuariibacter halophilus]|uniref:LysR family transcriptional regulator n=1 Tax=Fluctibacter halophilus TaxID=226011 RepID=A0ABS8G6P3_9ALTE|nr:LysR substrate-binding domain-containing protein [Aestuariibacter halophilus]MCC2616159.1 LysR family transcriptional regulator [Aestuariibacter halophilus]
MSLHPATLTCLQVFHAVVDKGSFSRAALHLNLTQSAVSHRIKQLEGIAGVTLIERSTRHLKITPLGEKLYHHTRLNLAEIASAFERLSASVDSPLSVTTISSLATKWLLPKLGDYNQAYPDQPLSVLTDDNILDLRYEGIDTAIRLTDTEVPGLHMTYICDEWVFPVASNALVTDRDIIAHPERLQQYPWLLDLVTEQGNDESSWRGWLRTQGLAVPDGRADQGFSRSDITLQATAAGQGIAIARASLVELDMLNMQLFKQVGRAVKMKYGYYFVCPEEKAQRPDICNLRHWVTTELRKTMQHVHQALVV